MDAFFTCAAMEPSNPEIHYREPLIALPGIGTDYRRPAASADAARSRRDRTPAGGIWQGLDERTGAVASAIWVRGDDRERAVVFVDVDGTPVKEPDHPGGC